MKKIITSILAIAVLGLIAINAEDYIMQNDIAVPVDQSITDGDDLKVAYERRDKIAREHDENVLNDFEKLKLYRANRETLKKSLVNSDLEYYFIRLYNYYLEKHSLARTVNFLSQFEHDMTIDEIESTFDDIEIAGFSSEDLYKSFYILPAEEYRQEGEYIGVHIRIYDGEGNVKGEVEISGFGYANGVIPKERTLFRDKK